MFSLEYLFVCLFSLALVVLAIVKVANEHPSDDSGDDDNGGGLNDWDAPLPDLPTGIVTMDEFEKEQLLRKEEGVA